MKKYLSSLIVASFISIPSLVWAGDESGLYIGGSVGQSGIDASVDDFSFDEDATGYKVLFGYNFGLIPLIDLAVEADYRDFGSFKDGKNNIKSDITSVDVYGLAGLNLGLLGVFAKVGYADTDVDTIVDEGKFTSSESSNTYGIGARIQLGSLAVRAEYEEFDVDNIDDLSMWSLGATYTF
ncbi:MAG: flagellar motor protein MotB [Cellvibrio sp. 79]|nr:MAG: flagellar motor protein MotB [Cellvibrio sp. 79]